MSEPIAWSDEFGGGGQQGPTLAAAGARFTVLDNSPRQPEQDELVARRASSSAGRVR